MSTLPIIGEPEPVVGSAASARPQTTLRAAPSSTPVRRERRPGAIERPRLLQRVLDERATVVALVAPAGFGKTTLLDQWLLRDGRPFARLALRAPDDDPDALCAALAAALARLRPRSATELCRSGDVAGLLHAVGSMRPGILVVDDVDRLRSPGALDLLGEVAGNVPPGSALVLASRREPEVGLGRLRARDVLAELRAGDLALTPDECRLVLERAGIRTGARDLDRLLASTGGWPAAVRLVVRAARERGGPRGAADLDSGSGAVLLDYVREEILDGLAPDDLALLERASVLDRLDGAACDAVLGSEGAASVLDRLRRDGVPVLPDEDAGGYVLHPLVRRACTRELDRRDPAAQRALHERASRFFEREGDLERAIGHAVAARDRDRLCFVLGDRAPALLASPGRDRVGPWLADLGDVAVRSRPGLAVTAALDALLAGERDTAERWIVVAAQRLAALGDGRPGLKAGITLADAALGRRGAAAMAARAGSARALVADDPWCAFALWVEGTGHALAGAADAARACLDEGARRAIFDAPLLRALCLGQLALLALDAGDRDEAARHASGVEPALRRADALRHPFAALPLAACAAVHAARGSCGTARGDLRTATDLLGRLPDAPPWYGAMTRGALARAALRMSDAATARALLSEASRLVSRAGDVPALRASVDRGWALADDFAAGPIEHPSTLTLAELRVLRLLPSHLTFREIAGRLHVSSNTVKTQVHSIYRKLDARSRSEAVAHAAAVGLVDV